MSSHHVVRENQEPALLIHDFKALDLEHVGQLLEWSPTLVASTDSLDQLMAEGIKVDVVFSENALSLLQEHTKVFSITNSFLEDALAYLIASKHKAVNIITASIPDSIQSFAKDINIVILSGAQRFVYVKSSFEKWKPKGDFIFVRVQDVKSFQGVDYKGDNVFVTLEDGFVQFEFNSTDYILLGEEI